MIISLVSLLLTTTSAFGSAGPLGKVIEVKGRLHSAANPSLLIAGSPVFEGDFLTTDKDSLARVLLDDGIAVQLGPESHIRVIHKEHTQIQLIAGSILSKLRALTRAVTGPRYEVITQGTVMGVRGTTFFVKQSPSKPAFLCVCEGTVEVTSHDHTESITARHHDHPKSIEHKTGKMSGAPMGADHTDADIEALERILAAH